MNVDPVAMSDATFLVLTQLSGEGQVAIKVTEIGVIEPVPKGSRVHTLCGPFEVTETLPEVMALVNWAFDESQIQQLKLDHRVENEIHGSE